MILAKVKGGGVSVLPRGMANMKELVEKYACDDQRFCLVSQSDGRSAGRTQLITITKIHVWLMWLKKNNKTKQNKKKPRVCNSSMFVRTVSRKSVVLLADISYIWREAFHSHFLVRTCSLYVCRQYSTCTSSYNVSVAHCAYVAIGWLEYRVDHDMVPYDTQTHTQTHTQTRTYTRARARSPARTRVRVQCDILTHRAHLLMT